MFRIGEFSKLGKTTVKTLRYYDEIGLLKPQEIDEFTKYRFYTSEQLITLHEIQALKQLGLSIEEIKLIISNKNTKALLEKRKAELISQIAKEQDQLSRIEFILLNEGEVISMKYQGIIKELPECIVYSKKMVAYFQTIPSIGEQVSKKYPDLKCASPEYSFISYLDGEYKTENISIEFCEAVEEMKEDFDDIVFKKIPSITALSVMHKGSYRELGKAYGYAYKWIEENNYRVIDNPRENYIDGIWNKEDESEWLTELQIPIEKKTL